jgi:WD40 repeat protein
VFLIEQTHLNGLAWLRPGLLLLAREPREEGRDPFVVHDTTARAERFSFKAGLPAYVAPILSASADGRWLVAHRRIFDLAPVVAALADGEAVSKPVLRPPGSDATSREMWYAVASSGALAFRQVETSWRTSPTQELIGLPGFDVRGECPIPEPCHSYPVALSDYFIVWLRPRYPPHREALVYSLGGEALQSTLTHTQGIKTVAFSRDGCHLATAAGVTVRVWDPESGECIRKFKGQRGNVQAIVFHPSGRFLAVSCADGAIRFWDVESGKELGSYAWGIGPAAHLAFSPDGSTAAAATSAGVVVWDVDV